MPIDVSTLISIAYPQLDINAGCELQYIERKCERCSNTGKVPCRECLGTGKYSAYLMARMRKRLSGYIAEWELPLPQNVHDSIVAEMQEALRDGHLPCIECDGTGRIDCECND